MILVDSSIRIDHLRTNDDQMDALLRSENVIIHPFVIGELSLGSMARYDAIMTMLADLPTIAVADDAEVRHMIRSKKLYGSGIGYVDAHILASTLLSSRHMLWTRDKRLHRIAATLSVAMPLQLH